MTVVDSAMTREVYRDISKRPLDVSQLNVHVTHGVVQLQGRVEKLRGYYEDIDLQQEMQMIIRLLKQKPGIRDVCCEVDIAGESLNARLAPPKRKNYQ